MAIMKKLCSPLLLAAFFVASSCLAADDGYTYNYTRFADYEAVDSDGLQATTYSTPCKFYGVVINNPLDMSSNGSGWWQTFIQAVPAGLYGNQQVPAPAEGQIADFGGTAVYMHRFNKVFPEGRSWQGDKDRVNYPKMYDGSSIPTNKPLRRGDVVMVDARAPGMFRLGKYNINDQHYVDESKQFNFTILQRDYALTAPTIHLDNLKDDDPNNFNHYLFDTDRTLEDNCEHYQGSLVHLDNLVLNSGTWAADGTVQVKQLGMGDLTFNLKLGLDSELTSTLVQSLVADHPFSITAILDQEDDPAKPFDPGSDSRFIDNYRLWLTNRADLSIVPEPGTFLLLAMAGLTAFGFAIVTGRD
jgi:hypothetical protein